jgi:formylglycine-generating enzyme required for sulfatase activity
MYRRLWAVGLGLVLLGSGMVLRERRAWAEKEKKPAPPPGQPTAPRPAPGMAYGQMVSIRAGKFTMGSTSGKADERPEHEVEVAAFSMDRTEVTVKAFKGCVDAGKCTEPVGNEYCNWKNGGRGGHPINCVDWTQATAFCSWAGKRLPTEAEWEYAARGTAGRGYPWGASAPDKQLCWSRNKDRTCAAGSFPAGATPEGLQDMAGNVWEWVEDEYCPYKVGDTHRQAAKCAATSRVLRGGSWDTYAYAPTDLRGANRLDSSGGNALIGFRCARSPLPFLYFPPSPTFARMPPHLGAISLFLGLSCGWSPTCNNSVHIFERTSRGRKFRIVTIPVGSGARSFGRSASRPRLR